MILLKNVSFESRQGRFSGINFHLSAGETAVILGPRHSGKTEFMRVCLGLHPFLEGEAHLFGNKLSPFGAPIGMSFPEKVGIVTPYSTLLDNLTVAANIGLPLSCHLGMGQTEMRSKVLPLMQRFGIAEIADEFPHKISETDSKMAMMARAVIFAPPLLVMDEPTAGDLDPAGFMRVLDAIRSLRSEKTTLLIFTSSPSLASLRDTAYYYLVDRLFIRHHGVTTVSDPLVSEYFSQIKSYAERQSSEISYFYKNVISALETREGA